MIKYITKYHHNHGFHIHSSDPISNNICILWKFVRYCVKCCCTNSWTFKKKFYYISLFSEPQLVITSTVQDLELLIFENRTVKFQVENASLLDNPIQIVFIENPNDVVKLTPTSVQIHKDDEDFYIQFYATDAGKTTVTVNKSTDILK